MLSVLIWNLFRFCSLLVAVILVSDSVIFTISLAHFGCCGIFEREVPGTNPGVI